MHKVLYRAGGIWAALIPVPVISGAYESNYVLEWMRIPFVEALFGGSDFCINSGRNKNCGIFRRRIDCCDCRWAALRQRLVWR